MLAISKEFSSDVFDGVEFKVQYYDYSAFGKILWITDGNDVTDAPPVVSVLYKEDYIRQRHFVF